jgi:hypothetical protein
MARCNNAPLLQNRRKAGPVPHTGTAKLILYNQIYENARSMD